MNLHQRLTAAIEQAEQEARAAQVAAGSLSPWVVRYGELTGYPQCITNAGAVLIAETYEGGPSQEIITHAPIAEYVAANDPTSRHRPRGGDHMSRADTVPHGTRSRYLYGCRCEPCVTANRAYRREHDKRQPAPSPTPGRQP